MKAIYILLFCTLLWVVSSVTFAAVETKAMVAEKEIVNTVHTEQYLQIALVWGWVKYYHPAANAGKLDIDAELFYLLTQQQLATHQEMSDILESWLTKLPDWPDEAKPTEIAWQLYRNQSMHEVPLPIERQHALAALANNPVKKPYYYRYGRWAPGYQPYHELNYSDFKAEQQHLVWLALFRYWNVIHYFFPYRYQMDAAWTSRFHELVPVFAQVHDAPSYRYALHRLTAAVQDGHAIVRRDNRMQIPGRFFLPVQFVVLEGKVLVQNSYLIADNSLQPGDEILTYQQQPTAVWLDTMLAVIPASGDPLYSHYLGWYLQRTDSSEVSMTVRRGELTFDVTVPTYLHSQLATKPLSRSIQRPKHQWLEERVAYLKIYAMSRKEFTEAYSLYQHADALILDLRGYPVDSGAFSKLMRYLVKGRTAALSFVRPLKGQPGAFHRFYDSKTGSWWPFSRAEQRPVIALMNAWSMSQSETNLMQLQQYPNTLLLGNNTAGANGDVTYVTVPGDYQLYFSGLGVYYPDGTQMQRYGVLPDVLAQQTRADLVAGQDTKLNTAVSIIKSGQNLQELRRTQAEKVRALNHDAIPTEASYFQMER